MPTSWRREQVLWLYAQPYEPTLPVICFDERPCFLIGDQVLPMPMRPGQPAKEHYTYEKHGSCALLADIEPLTGCRLGQVHRQRTKKGIHSVLSGAQSALAKGAQNPLGSG